MVLVNRLLKGFQLGVKKLFNKRHQMSFHHVRYVMALVINRQLSSSTLNTTDSEMNAVIVQHGQFCTLATENPITWAGICQSTADIPYLPTADITSLSPTYAGFFNMGRGDFNFDMPCVLTMEA
ncbi:hypothetical protein HOLleu_17463 [Holothuria leucospilota]|uniref:Uncharacterized protein n=1 Tax=Holothuria leucospilota TaxID=206669 RepID=A0A9Q1C1P9_HOLLE|nr:hypothetical protein HOLleu_17463 [Holothuria leucospilota]